MYKQVILHHFNIFSMLYTIYCIYSKIPTDDKQLLYSKHVEDDYWNKLRKKSSSFWSSLRKYIIIHGPQNIKFSSVSSSQIYVYFSVYYFYQDIRREIFTEILNTRSSAIWRCVVW
jgi:calcineurin-like phosphoesterase family protein